MELRDLLVTPLIILIVYWIAYLVRPYFTDNLNRHYFLPALTARIFCSIAIGFLYQFYYHGGDTFNYHTLGSRVVWDAFMKDPEAGLRLIFFGLESEGTYEYSSRILFVRDPGSYFIVRIASIFDILTFSTYSATAILFATVSFAGAWAFYLTFYRRIPLLHLELAWGILFIPSLVFWGSGILKDTIVLSAIGFAVYCCDLLFIRKSKSIWAMTGIFLSLLVIFAVKKFILQALIPTMLLWIYFHNIVAIRNYVLRIMILPLLVGLIGYSAYWSVVKIGEGDSKYAVDQLAETARITAYDIGFFTGKDAGSRYSLGELTGSFSDMLQKAPAAINVSLFRPYLWEIRNPLMLFSALESLFFTAFVFYVLLRSNIKIISTLKDPDVIFTLTVSLILAFAVGITSYNFGTLSRYKIPLLPFFATGLILILQYSKSERKFPVLDTTE